MVETAEASDIVPNRDDDGRLSKWIESLNLKEFAEYPDGADVGRPTLPSRGRSRQAAAGAPRARNAWTWSDLSGRRAEHQPLDRLDRRFPGESRGLGSAGGATAGSPGRTGGNTVVNIAIPADGGGDESGR